MKWSAQAICLCLVLSSCASPQASRSADPRTSPLPEAVEVICSEDGSTEVQNSEVAAQPDGVHFRVDNRAGEFVSLNGTGRDFSEGVTEQAAPIAPGEVKIACWPGSMHRGPEPDRIAVAVHDPNSYWVAAELECPRDTLVSSSTLDYASHAKGGMGNPESLAREHLKGLQESDKVFVAGYPESEYRDVAVERDGEIVAIAGYSPTDDGGWILGGYSACPSSAIKY